MARTTHTSPAGAQTAAPAKKAPVNKSVPAKKATTVNKTSSASQITPDRLVVLDGEKAWTKSEIDEVLTDLREHRERLVATLGESEQEIADLMRDAGDGAGQDQADLGATSFERDYELTVLANEREMLTQVERALSHIDEGTYGVCDTCANPIGKNRLMAFPRATLCISCKQREERR